MCTLTMNRTERGSALLVTLMVVVGLSLLGLGFVAISETESSISINERNYSQALAVAEAGAKTAVEWFQDPEWALANGLMPANDETLYPNMKRTRTVVINPGAMAYTYTGKYKTTSFTPVPKMFDKPYKPEPKDRLYGDEARADVVINSTTTSVAFMDALNLKLFNDKRNGEVTEIRVFAPPILNGTLNAGGFWEGGTRYGVASVKVTAQKRAEDSSRVIAERSVKVVVTEWPFPGPQGPVQSNANINTGGSFGVHWGRMTAQGNMEVLEPEQSIPWHDAWNWTKFEHGWENVTAYEWRSNYPVTAGTLIHPSESAISANPELRKHGYRVITPGNTGTAEPNWMTATTGGSAIAEASGTVAYLERSSQQYPNRVTTFNDADDSYNWMYELVNKVFEDPWYQARSRMDMTLPPAMDIGVGTSPFVYFDYNYPNTYDVDEGPSGANDPKYNLFQGQDQNNPKNQKEVTFPRIDYEFWKSIAQQADSAGTGAKYLRWNRTLGADNFLDRNNVSRRFWRWVNVPTGATAGFYFFDTNNGLNPQFPGGSAFLTPRISINSSDANPFQMQGFVYLNTTTIDFSGISGVNKRVNVPGEPFRDIGYRKVDPATGLWATDTAGNFIIEGANDGLWSAQKDLDGDTAWDVVLASRTFQYNDTNNPATPVTETRVLLPRTYDPAAGCTLAGIGVVGGCSEPAEPFLNIQYDATTWSPVGANNDPALRAGWGRAGPGAGTWTHVNQPKKLTPAGAVPVCGTNPELCTSIGYDKDGGLVTIEFILIGILYNEGAYTATGNPRFFGSLLMNGGFGSSGASQVYFDECLVKGCWEENFNDFPRVYISTHETDL